MKILQIKTSADRGGAETVVLQLTAELQKQGHDFLTLVGEVGWLIDRMRDSGLRAEAMPRGIFRQVASVSRHIYRFGPDALLVHGAQVAVPASLASLITGVPMITVEHCADNWRDTSWLRNTVDRQLIARISAGRIAVSRAVREVLIEKRIIDDRKVCVIPNGLELPSFVNASGHRREIRERFGMKMDDFIIVTVARMTEQKGHRYLLEAVPKIREVLPNCRFLWLGEGELLESIRADVRSRNLGSVICLPGAIDGVTDVLTAMDLFVLPSLWEGLPIGILEAMAVGLPVIATAVAGTPEVVKDGETGILVRARDPDAVAVSILKLAADSEMRNRIAQAGRKYVHEEHAIASVAERYVRILGHAIKRESLPELCGQ